MKRLAMILAMAALFAVGPAEAHWRTRCVFVFCSKVWVGPRHKAKHHHRAKPRRPAIVTKRVIENRTIIIPAPPKLDQTEQVK